MTFQRSRLHNKEQKADFLTLGAGFYPVHPICMRRQELRLGKRLPEDTPRTSLSSTRDCTPQAHAGLGHCQDARGSRRHVPGSMWDPPPFPASSLNVKGSSEMPPGSPLSGRPAHTSSVTAVRPAHRLAGAL